MMNEKALAMLLNKCLRLRRSRANGTMLPWSMKLIIRAGMLDN